MPTPTTNIPFSTPLYRNHHFYRRYGKRALDFTGALFGLICLFPVLSILAILLAIVQRTSPFFLQKRIGHGLKPFHIIKFKTMKDTRDKEGNLLPDEERTTVLGSLLRSTSLDELPELINVLLGDMSFIGPRPWMTFLISLLNVAYTATLTAHENFRVLATVEILLTGVKVICVILLYYVPMDRLIYFAGYSFLLTLASSGFYALYCSRHYPCCRYRAILDKPFLKEMGAFYSWNLFGSIAWLLKGSGINVVINLFFGVLINAAQAVASQVSAGVTALMGSFSSAMQPQITKSYAAGDYEHMWKLVFNGTRYSFFLLAVFILPLCFNIDFILSLWLKEIPAYTNIFVILFLANVLAESYSTYLITVLLATGKIAFYQASVGTILLLNVPLSYLAFQWGYPPVSFLVVSIILTFAASALRLFLLKKRFSFSITLFLRSVFLKTLLTILLVSALNFMLLNLRSLLPYGNILVLLFSCLISMGGIYILGLNSEERRIVIVQAKKYLHR